MDTKLKNSVAVAAWFVLFTFGMNAVCFLLFRSYFADYKFLYDYVWFGVGAFVVSLIWFRRVPVLESLDNDKWQRYLERIPIDVSIVIASVFGIYTVFGLAHVWPDFSSGPLLYVKGLAIGMILVTLTMVQVQSIIRRSSTKERWDIAWQHSVIGKMSDAIRRLFLVQSTGIQMVLLLSIVFASGFGIMVVLMVPQTIVVYALLFLIVTVPVLVTLSRHIGYLNRIIQHTSSLAQGNAESDLALEGRSALAILAGNINTLKHGVQSSMAAQAKSERLKAELITNVSHDLRTPLTSVITYAELLKDPDLTEEERTSYTEVIDRKSKRLKMLIDDLFEASKMASGSIELIKEQVDIVQLLEQALAEYDERISQSTLQFRIVKPDSPVHCLVDGQKLWRVFDNLIENTLKYSMEQSRVFISIKETNDKTVITFKNVTKYELSEDIDELFERFKRGDASRHTDGSGLGLAIAKSIVDLHGGSLDLTIDGDLFKATVVLSCVR